MVVSTSAGLASTWAALIVSSTFTSNAQSSADRLPGARWSTLTRAVRVLDHENLARVHLRMKALERQAARMAPRKYGNRR
jgi:hypothetical protein